MSQETDSNFDFNPIIVVILLRGTGESRESQEKKEQHGPEGGHGHLLAHVALLVWRIIGTYCANIVHERGNRC